MKKITAVVIFLFMLIFAIPSLAETDSGHFSDITWTYENGTLTISGSGSIDSDGPWSNYKKKIKHLVFTGDDLKLNCYLTGYKNVKTVTFGEGFVSVGSNVFQNFGTKKAKLIIASNDYIWNGPAFFSDTFASVETSEGVTAYVIKDQFVLNQQQDTLLLFFGKPKKITVIPDSVKTIGAKAFSRSKIQEIRLPQGLEIIADEAFAYCASLKQITIPETVHTIGSGVFSGCKKLTALNFINTTLQTDYQILPDYFIELKSLKELVVPNYTDISELNIMVCKSLETIIVSEGNQKLNGHNGMLYDPTSSKLKAIYLPASLNDISMNNLPWPKKAQFYVLEDTYAHRFVESNGYPFVLVTPITNVTLSAESVTLKVGKSTKLTATITPAEATSKKVQWMSTNENVATVQNGKIKAVAEGECDIICRGLDCGGITAVCHVTVTKK